MSGVLGVLLGVSGGAPGVINSIDASVTGVVDPNPVSAKWENDGELISGWDGGTGDAGDWCSPPTTTIAAYYQIKVDATSGTFSAGSDSTGTWLDLSSDRTWVKDSLAGPVTFTYSIREKATGIVRVTRTNNVLTPPA